jgi:ech hydrogenase subunit D
MNEKLYKEQKFIPLAAADLLSKAKGLKQEGYRLVQICATKVENGFELLYSFDKKLHIYNYKLTISEKEEIQSITDPYWYAFIYENEMHDLFGIDVQHMALDYEGRFFKVSEPTPWSPKKAESEVETNG